jgi:hypothetical protein
MLNGLLGCKAVPSDYRSLSLSTLEKLRRWQNEMFLDHVRMRPVLGTDRTIPLTRPGVIQQPGPHDTHDPGFFLVGTRFLISLGWKCCGPDIAKWDEQERNERFPFLKYSYNAFNDPDAGLQNRSSFHGARIISFDDREGCKFAIMETTLSPAQRPPERHDAQVFINAMALGDTWDLDILLLHLPVIGAYRRGIRYTIGGHAYCRTRADEGRRWFPYPIWPGCKDPEEVLDAIYDGFDFNNWRLSDPLGRITRKFRQAWVIEPSLVRRQGSA